MAVSQNLSVTQISQNVADNTSQVRIVWTSTQSGQSWNGYTRTAYYYVSINGGSEIAYSVSYTLPQNSTKTILDVTITVNHRTDGTGSVNVRTWMDTDISAGVIELDKALTLITIPSATTPVLSASSADMGASVIISTPRASASFTHDLAYSFNGGDYVNIASGVGESYTWTVPDVADSIPNDPSGTMTMRCITKDSSGAIGTKYAVLSANVPASVVPSIISVGIQEATTGLAAQFGAYIQGKSRLSVTVNAAGVKGSSITSCKTTLQGRIYTSSAFTSEVLSLPGELSMVTTVTDSRGRFAEKITRINVLAYTKPEIQTFSVDRCDAAGVDSSNGEYIAVQYRYSAPLLNGGNTADMVIEYKQSTEAQYTALRTGADLSADVEWKDLFTVFSTDYSYDVRITITDWFGAAAVATAQLPSGSVIMDIGANGDCASFGKTAEIPDTLDLNWNLRVRGTLNTDGPASFPTVNGVFMKCVELHATASFTVQTKFAEFSGVGNDRQSIFLFGNDNHRLIQGVIGISDAGGTGWSGTEEVSVTAGEAGVISVTLPTGAYDRFVLISPEYFH